MLRAEGRRHGGDHGGQDRAQVSPPQEPPEGEDGSGDQVGKGNISEYFELLFYLKVAHGRLQHVLGQALFLLRGQSFRVHYPGTL